MPFILNGTKCYSVKEAAEQAGLSESYISRLAKRGKIGVIVFRGNYFIPVRDFVEWQANKRKPGRPRKVK